MRFFTYPLMILLSVAMAGCEGNSNNSVGHKDRTVIGAFESYADGQITVAGKTYKTSLTTAFYGDADIALAALPAAMDVALTLHNDRLKKVYLNPNAAGKIVAINGTEITYAINSIGNDKTLSLSQANPELKVGDYFVATATDQAGAQTAVALLELPYADVDLPLYFDMEGTANALDTALKTFQLDGAVDVDYSAAKVDEDDGLLAEGGLVSVLGYFDNNLLKAIEVETENSASGYLKLYGELTYVNKERTQFIVSNYNLKTVENTTIFDDGSRADMAPGRLVKVSVRKSDNQVIKIEFEDSFDFIDKPAANTPRFEVAGVMLQNGSTLTLNGISYTLIDTTEYDDGLTASSDLNGKHLEIEGRFVNNQYQITEVGLFDANDTRMDIKGQVSIAGGTTKILGFTISLASNTSVSDGQWVSLECTIASTTSLTNCQYDY